MLYTLCYLWFLRGWRHSQWFQKEGTLKMVKMWIFASICHVALLSIAHFKGIWLNSFRYEMRAICRSNYRIVENWFGTVVYGATKHTKPCIIYKCKWKKLKLFFGFICTNSCHKKMLKLLNIGIPLRKIEIVMSHDYITGGNKPR